MIGKLIQLEIANILIEDTQYLIDSLQSLISNKKTIAISLVLATVPIMGGIFIVRRKPRFSRRKNKKERKKEQELN